MTIARNYDGATATVRPGDRLSAGKQQGPGRPTPSPLMGVMFQGGEKTNKENNKEGKDSASLVMPAIGNPERGKGRM